MHTVWCLVLFGDVFMCVFVPFTMRPYRCWRCGQEIQAELEAVEAHEVGVFLTKRERHFDG